MMIVIVKALSAFVYVTGCNNDNTTAQVTVHKNEVIVASGFVGEMEREWQNYRLEANTGSDLQALELLTSWSQYGT